MPGTIGYIVLYRTLYTYCVAEDLWCSINCLLMVGWSGRSWKSRTCNLLFMMDVVKCLCLHLKICLDLCLCLGSLVVDLVAAHSFMQVY